MPFLFWVKPLKDKDKKRLIRLYEDRYTKYGYDIKTVGWGSVESQRLRFKILCDIADLHGLAVCDLGCGFGDVYLYLQERFGNVNYHGIDISEKLIAEARSKYPKASFEVRDILKESPPQKFDFVLCSGALNFKIEDNEVYIEKMLRCMMDMAKEGISVNFLSSYADYSIEKNFHYSPEKAFSLGKEITRFVTLRHDYPLYEFTLYLYHELQPRAYR